MTQAGKLDDLKSRALRGEIILATPEGLTALMLQQELLKERRRKLESLAAYRIYDDPDARENPVYNETQTQLGYNLPRLASELHQQRQKSRVYTEPADHNRIVFACSFQLDDGMVFRLAGPLESSWLPQSQPPYVSYLSPLGRAVWGATVGDQLQVGGRVVVIKQVLA